MLERARLFGMGEVLERMRLGLGAMGLALGLLGAPAANAGDEFEDGFKDELGRIAAHEAVRGGRQILANILLGVPPAVVTAPAPEPYYPPAPPPPAYYPPPPPPAYYPAPVAYYQPYPVVTYGRTIHHEHHYHRGGHGHGKGRGHGHHGGHRHHRGCGH